MNDDKSSSDFQTLHWKGDAESGVLWMIDQTLLPEVFQEISCPTVEVVWDAIKVLRVRGAPAIGVAAAYGVVVGTQPHRHGTADEFANSLKQVCHFLATSRPTAVNLFWALDRMERHAASLHDLPPAEIHDGLLAEAKRIHQEDVQMCRQMGEHGAALLPESASILTHCNAGALATAGDGTALSVIYSAHRAGKRLHVFADETRPLLQGSRLTAWELSRRQIPVTVICDNMAAQVMKEGRIQAVITGADRIAANGDAANKIGTYGVAVLAKHHGIPFYVAAPSSTFDFNIPDGSLIPIEQRSADEIRCGFGRITAPMEAAVYNPAFDVTPASLITALITERGVIHSPTTQNIASLLGKS
ncbi:MAG: S-methyl-5-thioribose-1-phosphate isomerase [Planctomycetaceae bacterium]|nr:S-methyl-5-thioribose-1-phosphate isomerase [Planctomycetaceae bacterium]